MALLGLIKVGVVTKGFLTLFVDTVCLFHGSYQMLAQHGAMSELSSPAITFKGALWRVRYLLPWDDCRHVLPPDVLCG